MTITCSVIPDRLFGARTYRGMIKITKPGRPVKESINEIHHLIRRLAMNDALSMRKKLEVEEV